VDNPENRTRAKTSLNLEVIDAAVNKFGQEPNMTTLCRELSTSLALDTEDIVPDDSETIELPPLACWAPFCFDMCQPAQSRDVDRGNLPQ